MWWGGVSWVAGLGCRRFRCVLHLQVLHSILCHVFLDGQLVCMDQSAGHRLGCLMPDAFRRETTQWILLSNSTSAPKSSRDACGVAALMDLAAVCCCTGSPIGWVLGLCGLRSLSFHFCLPRGSLFSELLRYNAVYYHLSSPHVGYRLATLWQLPCRVVGAVFWFSLIV